MPRPITLPRTSVTLSLAIGLMMLTFGLLKLVEPFAGWYAVQVSASGLPAFSQPLGIATETLAGVLFLGAWVLRTRLAGRVATVWVAASGLVVAMMLVATYVHLHPRVPREVLPLKLKPPAIPLAVLAFALVNFSVLRKFLRLRPAIDHYGPWALVTGASAGIGAEFVRHLAAEGFNLVLVARTKSKLEELAAAILREHHVQVRIIPADLAESSGVAKVEADTEDIEIGLLVSNAGSATPGAFTWRSEGSIQAEHGLNATAPTILTQHYASRMVARRRGGIILVSSTFGHQPVPYFQHYAATKAYIASLGHALRVELKPQGVDVLVLSPGPTRTAMRALPGIDFGKMPLLWMGADSVVAAAMLGLRSGKAEVVPGVVNSILSWTGRRLSAPQTLASAFGFLTYRALATERRVHSGDREKSH